MKLIHHGGKCCGIKTVHGLYTDPDYTLPDGGTVQGYVGMDGGANSKAQNYYSGPLPAEKYKDRLSRYVTFYRSKRTGGILEVVIMTANIIINKPYDQHKWIPVLEKMGFRLVNSCLNSNSSNTVHVYHLNIVNGKVEFPKEKEVIDVECHTDDPAVSKAKVSGRGAFPRPGVATRDVESV